MKFFQKVKDGGPDSTVTAYVLVEIKSLFSIMLLRFDNGSRDAYHSHAFNCISWLLKGQLDESFLFNSAGQPEPTFENSYTPGPIPIVTLRDYFHKVESRGRSWVLTFRGPWRRSWHEWDPALRRFTTLTHGRKVVG